MTGSTCKYNKVTQQQKFHLLTLVLKEKMLIKEVALLLIRLLNLSISTTPLPKRSSSSIEITPRAINLTSKLQKPRLLSQALKRSCHSCLYYNQRQAKAFKIDL